MATAGMPASVNTRAMNRACATLTQKPRLLIRDVLPTCRCNCAMTCLAHASLAV